MFSIDRWQNIIRQNAKPKSTIYCDCYAYSSKRLLFGCLCMCRLWKIRLRKTRQMFKIFKIYWFMFDAWMEIPIKIWNTVTISRAYAYLNTYTPSECNRNVEHLSAFWFWCLQSFYAATAAAPYWILKSNEILKYNALRKSQWDFRLVHCNQAERAAKSQRWKWFNWAFRLLNQRHCTLLSVSIACWQYFLLLSLSLSGYAAWKCDCMAYKRRQANKSKDPQIEFVLNVEYSVAFVCKIDLDTITTPKYRKQ